MIPEFNDHGCLPEGIYDCTMDEAAARFAAFQSSDRRPRLWRRFTDFVRQVKGCGFVETLMVDGSFVTEKPDPGDIDLVLVVATNHDFSADLTPAYYSLLAQRRVRRRFGFDIVVVKKWRREPQTGRCVLSAGQAAARREERHLEDKIID